MSATSKTSSRYRLLRNAALVALAIPLSMLSACADDKPPPPPPPAPVEAPPPPPPPPPAPPARG
ncbi:hypothetical protein predicted by Glimmer/Critica [Acetobacter ghanensis]|uniref:Uncharacterized protein n=1 Tax=Acetobacter ghanensis TaxID=431306 RepID=A0A0U5BGI4_9PROT|nr:hypothetical protein [Acetobacter ghanensis]NHO39287.1 hypothetical protein [Acetobacter ghanensis]CEF54278.1 hypothetical protein predicted by Glimmer/Critica [Acetobacter ghanensis]